MRRWFAGGCDRRRSCEPPVTGVSFGLIRANATTYRRYTHRVVISNNRLVSTDKRKVRFRWKNYRDGSQQKTMTLDGSEYIRRFLIHVLPDGFHRIRHYGFLGDCLRGRKLAHSGNCLGWHRPAWPRSDAVSISSAKPWRRSKPQRPRDIAEGPPPRETTRRQTGAHWISTPVRRWTFMPAGETAAGVIWVSL
jgi:hypothetical protein